ncbi:MAG TPA: WxL domain-containing protein [Chloroflexota bacterium]|nr:WxL domain-containing protein [Chloroflexota bacterium]
MVATMRRVLTVGLALAIGATSFVAAHAASGPVSQPIKATVTINSSGLGALTFKILNGQAYTSNVNTGGTTSVTCTQTINNPTSLTSPASYLIQFVGSSKQQVDYLLCLAPYQVADYTGTGAGWHVTFQETQWTCTTLNGSTGGCTKGATITAGSTYMDVPSVTCVSPPDACTGNGASPSIKMTGAVPIDKGAVTVASAAKATSTTKAQGMGTYTFYPRTDKCGGTNTICNTSTGGSSPTAVTQGQLSLYAPSTVKNGYYASTLTESLTSGP